MSAVVKLSSKLPGEEEINGVDATVEDLIAHPDRIRIGVVYYDAAKVVHDVDAGTDVPTIRVRRLEPVGFVNDAPAELRAIVDRAVEQRTGRKALPFEQIEVVEQGELDEGEDA